MSVSISITCVSKLGDMLSVYTYISKYGVILSVYIYVSKHDDILSVSGTTVGLHTEIRFQYHMSVGRKIYEAVRITVCFIRCW